MCGAALGFPPLSKNYGWFDPKMTPPGRNRKGARVGREPLTRDRSVEWLSAASEVFSLSVLTPARCGRRFVVPAALRFFGE